MLDSGRELSAVMIYGPRPTRKSYNSIFSWMVPSEPVSYERIEAYRDLECEDGSIKLFLFQLEANEGLSRLGVLMELDPLGFRPLWFEELMSFAASAWPEDLQGYTLPALAAVGQFAGLQSIPAVRYDKQRKRGLVALPGDTRWNARDHRILVTPCL